MLYSQEQFRLVWSITDIKTISATSIHPLLPEHWSKQSDGFAYGDSIMGGAKAQSDSEPTYSFWGDFAFFLLLEPEHLRAMDLQVASIIFPQGENTLWVYTMQAPKTTHTLDISSPDDVCEDAFWL